MTLKMRSRSPKFNQLLSWSIYRCRSEENPSTGSKDILLTKLWPWKWGQGHQNLISSSACHNNISVQVWRKSIRWFKRYPTYKTMTLKMRSRSSKIKHIINLSQWYSHASLKNIHHLVQEISHFSWKFNICKLAFDLENIVKVKKK